MMGLRDALKRKWRSQEGDTLVESLAALLIAALGAAALATMVVVASNASIASNNALQASYAAESNMPASGTGNATIKCGSGASAPSATVYITVYRSSSDPAFVRYEPAKTTGLE